jgi:hypothetical protein
MLDSTKPTGFPASDVEATLLLPISQVQLAVRKRNIVCILTGDSEAKFVLNFPRDPKEE